MRAMGHMGAPSIYYQDEAVTLWWGDCREVLPTLPRACADLIVTDPPYGQNFESGRRAETFGPIKGDADTTVALDGVRLALRCLRDKRHLYVFGRYDWRGLPVTEPVELIWDKGIFNGGDLTQQWGNQHEYIQFMVLYQASTERAKGGGALTARLRKGSVLRVLRPSGSAVMLHPTQKPVPLLRQLIESSSCFDETVLDPFAGVGSTLIAARLEGRKSIGIECEERYAEIAARRLSQAVMPLEVMA